MPHPPQKKNMAIFVEVFHGVFHALRIRHLDADIGAFMKSGEEFSPDRVPFYLGSILVTQWNCWTAMKTTSIRDLTIWPKHGDVNQFENTTWARLGPILETTLRRQQGALWTAMLHSIRTRAKTPCRRLWKPAFLLGWRNWRRMKHSSAPKRSWCSVWFTENIFWCFCDVRNFFLQSKFTSHCNLYLTDFSYYHLAVSTISYHKVFQK